MSDRELEWNDLAVLMAVCRSGSLSGAARELGHNHSTVFRRVNSIEERTGVRFFERLSNGYKMTAAGEIALRYAERVESEVFSLGREVLGQDARLRGKVRITGPESVTSIILPEALRAFTQEHPGVQFDLIGTSSVLDLARREADIAIRATRKPPNVTLGRKVCRFRFGLYASPDYLKVNQDRALHEMKWCLVSGFEGWLVPHIFNRLEDAEAQVVLAGDSTHIALHAAATGVGVTVLPCSMADPDPRVTRIGDPIERLTLDLWVLTHSDLRDTARVKVLMAYLYDCLHSRRALFEGTA
ncbi:MAG: LysR family transcriptional regulator [Deltaproteobacteria bacterium]|nr:LysR family transcriptional regulator [Deltaproteobacteria bacterium]